MEEKKEPYNILLIGCSQSGKSSLGNRLVVPPDEEVFVGSKFVKFKIGSGPQSCTTEIKTETFEFDLPIDEKGVRKKKCVMGIVDTPGIDDTQEENEERNMLKVFSLLSSLRNCGERISLAILVVRFTTKIINENFMCNVRYYKQLFPEVFANNVMLIVTGVDRTPDKFEILNRSKGEVDNYVNTIRSRITQILGLEKPIVTRTIDSFARMKGEENINYKHTLSVRNFVLCRACKAQKIDIGNPHFVKPGYVRRKDYEEIIRLNVQIRELRKQLIDPDDADGGFNHSKELVLIETQIQQLEDEHVRISRGLVLDRGCGPLEITSELHVVRPRKEFVYSAEFPIASIEVSGGSIFKDERSEDGRRTNLGVRNLKIFASLNAVVEIYVRKNDYYRTHRPRDGLRLTIPEVEARLIEEREKLEDLRRKKRCDDETQNKIEFLFRRIEELNAPHCSFQDCVIFFGKDKKIVTDGYEFTGMIDPKTKGIGRLGLYVYKSGPRKGMSYEGEFKDGVKHGHGILYFEDREIITTRQCERYEGQFFEGEMSGFGRIVDRCGVRFEGEFKNDQKNGDGKMFGNDGSLFTGTWKDDIIHGKGVLFPDRFDITTGIDQEYDMGVLISGTDSGLKKEEGIKRKKKRPSVRINKKLFEIDYKDLKCISQIGSGCGSSVVFLFKWKGTVDVAFKCFQTRMLMDNQANFDAFEKEVRIMGSVRHPSILHFYGACLQERRVGIVMEYCRNGDLEQFLGDNDSFSLQERFRVFHEISSGMEYLHDNNVLHRDLKPKNVLLDNHLKVKIMDFGVSKIVERISVKKTPGVGTGVYMAPEVMTGENYDEKCDVFSFGILCYEVITGDFRPYGDLNMFQIQFRVRSDPAFRPDIGKVGESLGDPNHPFLETLGLIWNHDPQKRPSFGELKVMFSKMKDEKEWNDKTVFESECEGEEDD